jgi:hypothetical protein
MAQFSSSGQGSDTSAHAKKSWEKSKHVKQEKLKKDGSG